MPKTKPPLSQETTDALRAWYAGNVVEQQRDAVPASQDGASDHLKSIIRRRGFDLRLPEDEKDFP